MHEYIGEIKQRQNRQPIQQQTIYTGLLLEAGEDGIVMPDHVIDPGGAFVPHETGDEPVQNRFLGQNSGHMGLEVFNLNSRFLDKGPGSTPQGDDGVMQILAQFDITAEVIDQRVAQHPTHVRGELGRARVF